MEIFEIDKRTKDDITMYIKEISKNYTPEWRFDEENPDIGTVLSLVYAEFHKKTLKQLNKTILKNKIAFFNSIDAKLLPAKPSTGYVTFGLVNEDIEGTQVEAGTTVTAQPKSKEGRIYFETTDDLYVTPAKISNIFQASDNLDYISYIHNINQEPFGLFEFKGENLQEHILYFSHNETLFLKSEGWITLSFYLDNQNILTSEIEKVFLDENNISFEYATENGFIPFSKRIIKDGKLMLLKSNNQHHITKTILENENNYWIRCKLKDIKLLPRFSFDQFLIGATGKEIIPQYIYGAGVECNIEEYFPFGEKMGMYTESYFSSDEVLSKKGATIKFNFTMEFVRIALEVDEEPKEIQWNWVMKRSDFTFDKEYDITIQEVMWEYYNGNGWSKLFKDNSYSDIFNTGHTNKSQLKTITFICPDDINPVLINSCESYYIRARILKMNNQYKVRGNYITPILSGTYFSYEYETNGIPPQYICTQNNLERNIYSWKTISQKGKAFVPFINTGEEKPALYLGYKIAPVGGPIKILITLSDIQANKLPTLSFEYFSSGKWKSLKAIDETENLRKSGLITFIGRNDFSKSKKFGKELYWIRLIDETNYYGNANVKSNIWITGIYMNTVNVISVKTNQIELYTMRQYKENAVFKLLFNNIYDIEVWINESDYLSDLEILEMEREGEIDVIYHDFGTPKEVWVKWQEVSDFDISSKVNRHYIVDKNEGIITFGNGKNGMIPPTSKEKNIKVRYRSGGGEFHNVGIGEINKLNRTIGFINSVENIEFTSGGCDKELTFDSLKRNGATLKNRGRAVSTGDFEELAMEATRAITKAKCFSGYNERGEKASGYVTLVVIQKGYDKDKNFFQIIKEDIYLYLKDKISPNLIKYNRFHIVRPVFVEVNVRIEVAVRSFQQVFWVKSQVLDRLNMFLDPMSGNFNGSGWDIGELPNTVQIQNAIYNVKEIVLVKHLSMILYSYEGSKKTETDMEEIKKSRFILPVNGKHEVFVTVE